MTYDQLTHYYFYGFGIEPHHKFDKKQIIQEIEMEFGRDGHKIFTKNIQRKNNNDMNDINNNNHKKSDMSTNNDNNDIDMKVSLPTFTNMEHANNTSISNIFKHDNNIEKYFESLNNNSVKNNEPASTQSNTIKNNEPATTQLNEDSVDMTTELSSLQKQPSESEIWIEHSKSSCANTRAYMQINNGQSPIWNMVDNWDKAPIQHNQLAPMSIKILQLSVPGMVLAIENGLNEFLNAPWIKDHDVIIIKNTVQSSDVWLRNLTIDTECFKNFFISD